MERALLQDPRSLSVGIQSLPVGPCVGGKILFFLPRLLKLSLASLPAHLVFGHTGKLTNSCSFQEEAAENLLVDDQEKTGEGKSLMVNVFLQELAIQVSVWAGSASQSHESHTRRPHTVAELSRYCTLLIIIIVIVPFLCEKTEC